ncbi:stress activated MAP kinase interacting protein Sin1 [Schizosaccharomyces japonicus yFS275]|uniref:Stress activated MAP kinase interacting protein Sin1 n=1 Tax=Schizosaccharomyces japonicus (strain yFS275 / FY16936) TaxID=402676 RepID=B6JXH8_SCHJY|nr:stress activated MAP kinase interacting protein Sin1 [Schizosaccharomyces japonicus yFS275]EEB05122.2 stress activated MAP kinase interacting protein Sin1 [Schizosaccharomyces japonicus yFS275]
MQFFKAEDFILGFIRCQYLRNVPDGTDERIITKGDIVPPDYSQFEKLLNHKQQSCLRRCPSPVIVIDQSSSHFDEYVRRNFHETSPRKHEQGDTSANQTHKRFPSDERPLKGDDNECVFSFSKVPMQFQDPTKQTEIKEDTLLKHRDDTHPLPFKKEDRLTALKFPSSSISTEIGTLRSISDASDHSAVPSRHHIEAVSVPTESELSVLTKQERKEPTTDAPVSALTTIFQRNSLRKTSNPLVDSFAMLSGKTLDNPLKVDIYCPFSEEPEKPLKIMLKPSVTVEEAIGYILYEYIENGQKPELPKEQQNPNYWNLRIVEDDGEIDEDFPSLDRHRPLAKFSFDAFALAQASENQIKENQQANPFPPTSEQKEPSVVENIQQTRPSDSSNVSSESLSDKDYGVFHVVHVRLFPYNETARSTAIEVTKDTRLSSVLIQVCRIHQLERSKYVLRISGTELYVPTDKTFQLLDGFPDLDLVKQKYRDRRALGQANHAPSPGTSLYGSTTHDLLPPSFNATDIVSSNAYQKFIVWRKQPMSFMSRHERLLAIDGEYVHIMPSESKTIFETSKTSSVHASSITKCKQSRKSPFNFKMIVSKSRETKRYDFEAMSQIEAATIVSRINALVAAYSKNNYQN